MNWSRLWAFGSEGFLRRFPVAVHFLLSGSLGAMFFLIAPSAGPLLRGFNDWTLGGTGTLAALGIAAVLYPLFFVYLASTKAVLDWILDGK